MARKIIPLVTSEFYHVYNRGVDKRDIFLDGQDFQRFLTSMELFNSIEPIGSLFKSSKEKNPKKRKKLVGVICYYLNKNHYHLILKQRIDGGISEFMKRLNGGYTCYFNEKHKRSGSLLQGVFKVKHVLNNNYLLHLSAYVNLNNRVHRLRGFTPKSSWQEYLNPAPEGFCEKSIVLGQFKNAAAYKKFAEEALESIIARRIEDENLEDLLLEGSWRGEAPPEVI